jgi:hypothetical protein
MPVIVDPIVITKIVTSSSLASVTWDKDRGGERAPIGYLKGMGVMFAVMQKKLADGNPIVQRVAQAQSGNDAHDALAHFNSKFTALGTTRVPRKHRPSAKHK